MRVISGDLKGRKLQSVSGTATRPTSDRVREALFNILGTRPKGALVLDLFAGTGALGIEALSRGANRTVFIDNSVKALTVLRQNLDCCRLKPSSLVVQWNIRRNLNCLSDSLDSFDLIFMDPPYRKNLVQTTLGHLLDGPRLDDRVLIVAEHEPEMTVDLNDTPWVLNDHRRYGQTALSFFSFGSAEG